MPRLRRSKPIKPVRVMLELSDDDNLFLRQIAAENGVSLCRVVTDVMIRWMKMQRRKKKQTNEAELPE